MEAALITPFVDATLDVLKTMSATEAHPGSPDSKADFKTPGQVSGIIAMAGDQLSGNLVLSFEGGTIVKIVNKMLMESYDTLCEDVVDAVGEITNMIAGGAKKRLADIGYTFAMATPVVIVGSDMEMKQLSPETIVSVPFETDAGKFWVELNLVAVPREVKP